MIIEIKRRSKICVHARKLGKDRSYRAQHGEFVCTGNKMFSEALINGAEIVCVITSLDIGIPNIGRPLVYEADMDTIASISPLKNARELLTICKIPAQADIDYGSGTHILLNDVQDPGNIGTVIRSADAFGIDSVILTEGCADPYNPKAARASAGAIFRQKIAVKRIDEICGMNARFIGTDAWSGYPSIGTLRLKNSIIVFGNEGRGVSLKLKELCEEIITIPLAPGRDSLNVATAASIIMWEAQKEDGNDGSGGEE